MNALLLTLQLVCTSPYYGMTIYVDAKVESETDYQVTLKDSRNNVMEMFRSEIRFDEVGSISEIDTHHMVENFNVKKTTAGWVGLYQYDLGYYPLTCVENE